MRRGKRFLALLLATSMLVSSEGVSLYASEVEEVLTVSDAEGIETTEATEVIEGIVTTEVVEEVEIIGNVAEVPENLESTEQQETPPNGYIPLPQEYEVPAVNYDLGDVPQYFTSTLESYYVTPNLPLIRDQNPYGTCWAFSSICLGELDLLRSSMGVADLSELHLAYFTYNSVADPLGGTAGDYNGLPYSYYGDFLDTGGNLSLAANILAGWMGMVEESKVPYDTAEEVIEAGIAAELAYDDVVHLKNAYLIDIFDNPEIVKAMIKEYGAAGISYYASDEYYDEEHNSYYVPEALVSNHAVTIVGWDDTFPKENFMTAAPEDGAWLVRNSWGSYYDEMNMYGYFWLSYSDMSLVDTSYVFDVTIEGQDDFYDNNYQYDGGMYSGYYRSSGDIEAANVFTANAGSDAEVLSAVMFSTTYATNQTYQIKVYTDLADATVPDSGTLVTTESGTCTYAGVYTVELSEPVTVDAGETFSVVVTIYRPEGAEYGYIDCEYYYNDWFVTEPTACEGQSYVKGTTAWADFGAQYGLNLRIKAFTNNGIPATGVEIASGDVELGLGESITLTANVLPSNAANKNVTWISGDESVVTVDETGKVTAANYGTAEITATTVEGGFTASVTVNVTKKLVSISLDREKVIVPIGEETTLTVSYNPTDTISDKRVIWSSSDEAVATVTGAVDEEGNGYAVVTATGCGRAVITAKVAGKEASCVIGVPPQATEVMAKSNENGSVEVSWQAVEGCTDYVIYRREADSQTAEILATVESGITSYTDSNGEAGVRYYYSVETVYDDGNGDALKTESEEAYVVYRIAYVLNGGTNASGNPAEFCEQDEQIVLADPQYDIAIFEGWYLDEAFESKVTVIDPADYAENITLYAKWRMRQEIQEAWLVYEETQEYTEAGIIPEITVKNGAYILVKDTDYTMAYVNETVDEIRICRVTITGIGEYIGTQTITIREKGIVLLESMIEDIPAMTYTGNGIVVEPVVAYAGEVLQKDKDYSVSYKNNTNAGTAQVVITGMGRYEGTVEKSFQIQPKVLEDSFASEITEQSYIGEVIQPAVVLAYNTMTLQKNTDYTISYSNNINVGTATAIITGCGNYTGSIQVEFDIVPADIQASIDRGDVKVLFAGGSESHEESYIGEAIEPAVTLVLEDGSKLSEGRDYSVSYVNNVVPGTATVIISGSGNYKGTAEVNFVIQRAILSDSMVDWIPAVTYTGDSLEPEVFVVFMGETLVKDTDYTVAYENNINVGTATVKITGIGCFQGTVEKNFKIQAKSLEKEFIKDIEEVYYTGTEAEPSLVLQYNGNTLVKNVDYEVSYRNNITVGTAAVIIRGCGNYTGTIRSTFDIQAADLELLAENGTIKVLIEGTEGDYKAPSTGNAVEPAVTLVLADGSELIEKTDFTVTYENNIEPGMATIKISGNGNYTGTVTASFEVKKHDIGDAVIVAGKKLTVLYAPTGQKPVAKAAYADKRLVEGQDFEAVYYLLNEGGERIGTALEKVTNAGTYELVLRGMNNFTGELEMASIITVKARSFAGGAIRMENTFARYDQESGNVTANYKLWYQETLLTKDVDYTVVEIVRNENNSIATFVFEGKGNYSGKITQQFPLIPADVIMFSEGAYEIVLIENQTYTGNRIEPEISVVKVDDAGTVLQKDVDYTVTCRYNLNVGTATVTVTGMGRCVGELTASFEIVPAEVGDVTESENTSVTAACGVSAEISSNEFIYDGTILKPTVSVTAMGTKLKAGTDYSVSYQDINGNTAGKDAGTYYVLITMQGNYTGTIKFAYDILPISLENVTVSIPDFVYTGVEIVPTIENIQVSVDGRLLTAVEKAGLTASTAVNNVNVTTAAAVTIAGTGNFIGEIQHTFKIIARDINDESLEITLGGQNVVEADTGYKTEWNGSAQTPEVIIKNGDIELISGQDYTLVYRYNTEIGTARVIISGQKNYQGVYTLFFEITGMEFSEDSGVHVLVEEDIYYYNGQKVMPSVAVTKADTQLAEGVDYTVSYINNINAGTAKVVVTGIGDYEGSITKTFTILPKTLEQADTVKISDIPKQRYTREVIVPEFVIEIDGEKLTKDKDYMVTALNAVEVGTGTVIVTGKGNYKGLLGERNFEIYKTTITYVLNGGVNSPNNPAYYTATDAITLSAPTRDAYNFAGWYTDKACTKKVTGIKVGTTGNKTFYAKWTPKQVYGIDVSKWQGVINWSTVSQTDKVFAMIRLSHGTSLDPYFETNYSGARNAGVKVGVYCYNEASTIQGAIDEANYVLSVLKGRTLDYPIAYDLEGVTGISQSLRTDMVYAFKNVVEAAGYEFILYANKNWLDNYFDNARLAPLDLWIARYCDYSLGHRYTGNGNVRIWQYSDKGSVNGISGNVDLDVCYEDYVKK